MGPTGPAAQSIERGQQVDEPNRGQISSPVPVEAVQTSDSPGLQELIQEIDSYTELSPSGKGVHIIVKHGLGAIKNAVITTASGLTIEIKPNTYSTYTGNIIHDFPIKDATDLIRTTYKILDAGIEKSKMGIEATVAAKGGNRVLFPEAYIKAAILKECERVRAAAKGTRTNTLLSAASKLGRFQYSRNIIEEKLRSAARPTGLNDDKIKRTIEAGFRYNHLLI